MFDVLQRETNTPAPTRTPPFIVDFDSPNTPKGKNDNQIAMCLCHASFCFLPSFSHTVAPSGFDNVQFGVRYDAECKHTSR
jgi:hypothetical protein